MPRSTRRSPEQIQIDKLEQRVLALEESMKAMRLKVYFHQPAVDEGELWLSPPQAASHLSVSASFIRDQIKFAESNPRKSLLKFGIHFKYKSSPTALKSIDSVSGITYLHRLVNLVEIRKVLFNHPDNLLG
ncbi:MAG: hypothetical protein HY785_29405 [Oscillatoriophycideae cyanobacterium NC_groundwater_1537_Pr4_S-0.65um_50_18]|nr:hypothetical protein [Oscillatoriophycideae cyanobacterium NC_groundwater_1537_Pr4_S-0.65um_50_18]